MHLLAAFRIQERCRTRCMPFRASSSTVFSWAWRKWQSLRARAASGPCARPERNRGVLPIMHFVSSVRRAVRSLGGNGLRRVCFARRLRRTVAESHTQGSRAAISAIHATDPYDNILPQAAIALEAAADPEESGPAGNDRLDRSTRRRWRWPARRADLEREVALAYARVYSEAAAQRRSPPSTSRDAGKKLLSRWPDRRPRSGQGRRHLAARHCPRPDRTRSARSLTPRSRHRSRPRTGSRRQRIRGARTGRRCRGAAAGSAGTEGSRRAVQ